MARRRASRRMPDRPRDVLSIANQRLRPVVRSSLLDLRLIEDRRLFPRQLAWPKARRLDGHVLARVAEKRRGPSLVQAFVAPRSVAICVRRKRRKEVLHARGVAGGRVRRGKRNQWLDVRC